MNRKYSIYDIPSEDRARVIRVGTALREESERGNTEETALDIPLDPLSIIIELMTSKDPEKILNTLALLAKDKIADVVLPKVPLKALLAIQKILRAQHSFLRDDIDDLVDYAVDRKKMLQAKEHEQKTRSILARVDLRRIQRIERLGQALMKVCEAQRVRGVDGSSVHSKGKLVMRRVSQGSKSEREAPAIELDDDHFALVYFVGDNPYENESVQSLLGKQVELQGKWRRGTIHVPKGYIREQNSSKQNSSKQNSPPVSGTLNRVRKRMKGRGFDFSPRGQGMEVHSAEA